jgi:crossover junction endodeoxyribonuclease RuvC
VKTIKTNTKILSIDQSTVLTGIAIFEDKKYKSHSLIDLHKLKNSDEKFDTMCKELWKLMKDVSPAYIVFEDVSLQTNVSILRLLSQLQGIIIAYCILNEIPFTIYKPTEWRKLLGFKQGKNVKRPELKQQAKDYVLDKYNLTVGEDEADAICIGEALLKEIS